MSVENQSPKPTVFPNVLFIFDNGRISTSKVKKNIFFLQKN